MIVQVLILLYLVYNGSKHEDGNMKEVKRFFLDMKGIFTDPGQTLGGIMERKQWIPAFFLIGIFLCIATYIIFPFQMEKSAEMLSQLNADGPTIPSAALQKIAAFAGVFFFFIQVTIVAFFLYLFYGIGGSDGVYANFLAVTVNGAIVGTLIPTVLRVFFILLRIDIEPNITPAVFMTQLQPHSWTYLIFSQFGIFTLWFMVIVAMGIGVHSKMGIRKTLAIMFVYFIFRSTILVLFAKLFAMLRDSMAQGMV